MRAVYHMKHGDKKDQYVGNNYFRPTGIYDETIELEKNVEYLILKDELDYEFNMIFEYDKEMA